MTAKTAVHERSTNGPRTMRTCRCARARREEAWRWRVCDVAVLPRSVLLDGSGEDASSLFETNRTALVVDASTDVDENVVAGISQAKRTSRASRGVRMPFARLHVRCGASSCRTRRRPFVQRISDRLSLRRPPPRRIRASATPSGCGRRSARASHPTPRRDVAWSVSNRTCTCAREFERRGVVRMGPLTRPFFRCRAQTWT